MIKGTLRALQWIDIPNFGLKLLNFCRSGQARVDSTDIYRGQKLYEIAKFQAKEGLKVFFSRIIDKHERKSRNDQKWEGGEEKRVLEFENFE